MIDYEGALICSHEAAHAAAAIMLGRKIDMVGREGKRHAATGGTISSVVEGDDPVTSAEKLIIVALAPVFEVGPRGADADVVQARFLGSFPGVDLERASDAARLLIVKPEFRRIHRVIEWALHSRPVLTGAECELIVALERESECQS